MPGCFEADREHDEERESTTVTRWMLSNGNGRDVFPASEEELVRGLTEMDAQARNEGKPRLAVLTADADADDAPYLSIGLGSDESVLVYEGHEAQGGYSKGTRTDDNSTMF